MGNTDKGWNEEVPNEGINEALGSALEGLSDESKMAVLEAYKKIPSAVKKAVEGFYEALGGLGYSAELEDVKKGIKEVEEACGEEYEGVYKLVLRDAKRYVPKIQTKHLMEEIGG